jgi:hypothetical protein
MARAFGLILLLLAFAMLFAGIGLLIGGEIVLKSGKISKPVGRKAAFVLLAFFPVVFVVHYLLRLVDPDGIFPSAVLYWPLALVCLGLAIVWLRRGIMETAPRSYVIDPTIDATEDSQLPRPIILEYDNATVPPPPTDAPAKPRAQKANNPFDFS